MLKNQLPQDLQYMLLVYFDEGKTKSGQKVKRSFYIFPKHLPNKAAKDVGVIGGTFIEGATSAAPNKEEFELILQVYLYTLLAGSILKIKSNSSAKKEEKDSSSKTKRANNGECF
jgi:hypothetical protein